MVLISVPEKPATATSWGILRPSDLRRFIAPMASVSVKAKMASNCWPRILSTAAAPEPYDNPSVNISAFSSENYDSDDYDFDKSNLKNACVKLDILGKVQIQGTLSNVRKFVDYLEEADDNDTNELTYKSYINQANSLANINLFYDGNSIKQASVKLEPFEEETWNGHYYWESEPVIIFFDGSSYSTIEAFFNDKDFKKVIDTFKALANMYADFIGETAFSSEEDEQAPPMSPNK